MSNLDYPPDFPSTRAELEAGILALEEGDYAHAHTILLALFISPDIPSWFRTAFCTAPMRELSLTFLPTRAALRRMRQRADTRMMDGDHNPALLQRALMLDDALGDMVGRYRLLRRLDVVAGNLLVTCRDGAMTAFAEHADMRRARRYLGDYRDMLASLSALQDMSWLYSKTDGWAEGAALANTRSYLYQLAVVEAVLRANGEFPAADSVQEQAAQWITRAKFRRLLAQERSQPGWCDDALRKWYERQQPGRNRLFEGRHGYASPRPHGGPNALA
ncbi:hypothetical protein [Pseudoduganella sp. GCM10020061]|uniref:hypothetical protein n=1 Tax=Pseudoduganella sp. GCM10020061 TaxID=3317345 RepID=UPI0036391A5A